MEFTLYILECADGSFCIGHTDDLGKRLAQHDEGKGCVYTSTRRPLKLLHTEGFETRYESFDHGAQAERLEQGKETGVHGRRLESCR
ncbi:MAG TPA: GIY-YIG nuclease family protein [Rhodanobacter sp.]